MENPNPQDIAAATELKEQAAEAKDEVSLEDVVSQLMVDNMALKSLLVQKGVFSQEDLDATISAISDEILKGEEDAQPEAGS